MKQSSLGRRRDVRNLLIRNLATSVILYESVVTTAAKARAVRPVIDRLIRIGQTKDSLTARRRLQAYVTNPQAVDKILHELTSRFEAQTSGFTRSYQLPPRLGDGAPRVILQLTKTVLVSQAVTPPAATPPAPEGNAESQPTSSKAPSPDNEATSEVKEEDE